MLLIMLAIQTGLCAIIPLIMYLILRSEGSSRDEMSQSMQNLANDRLSFPGALISTVSSSLSWGLPLLIVLTASAFGGEFAWGTLRLLISRGEGRREYCLSKIAALFLAWLFLMACGIVASLMTGALATAWSDGQSISAVEASDLIEYGGLLLAGMLAGATYISLTALLAMQTRSSAFAIAAGLATFFGDRIITGVAVGFGFRPIELLLRSGLSFNISSLTGESGDTSNPVFLSVAILMIYGTAFAYGATRILRRIDITVSGVG
jgi:ABC-type transport system involved in multi-copper enzyme maturation permease subunit